METQQHNPIEYVSDVLFNTLHRQKSQAKDKWQAECYIVLLLLSRLTLRYLDELEGSVFQKNKMKHHTNGWLKETEALAGDVQSILFHEGYKDAYEAMEGQLLAIEWVASLKITDLIAIARAGGIELNQLCD